ncbi:phage antirepressor KilAC domain-containing protein [Pontibacillus salipaludis]|uniref:Antirepressor - phage associated n=1 Tax=Pontibacillus salipaludis TaxID=1697394 RepID=A0ABQ1PX03_9BACI|nr:phage antirepressor [Pontibacillus salipaludis]GGD05130.1 putative antirepressor - phage associated [Pontibacillus salipaludis]
MNELSEVFNGQQLRIVQKENEPWFLLNDVVKILDLSNSRMVKDRLGDEVSSTYPIQDSLGRTQQATFVNEDGLYDVILDSRKPEARKFRKWITSEVIPSVRKHGAYATDQTIENIMNDPEFGIQLLTDLKEERNKRKEAETQRDKVLQQQQIDQPYTNFGKVVSNSNSSINVGAFAKMMYEEHGIKVGRNKMFKWLRDKGYLIRSGRERNNPKQKYIEQGLFETTVTVVSRTQGDIESLTTLITGKGQVKLAQKLLNDYPVAL